tara:strand:+ start:5094 stop:5660 length:567 start_codon:yes stop_codon:yes gene_type:complete
MASLTSINQFDVIHVLKTTRAKAYTQSKAVKGESYLVTSCGPARRETVRVYCIDLSGNEFLTTAACCTPIFNIDTSVSTINTTVNDNINMWRAARVLWKDKTYVPVLLMHFYSDAGKPITQTDNSVYIAKPLTMNNKNGFWLNKKYIHDDDLLIATSSNFKEDMALAGKQSEVVSIRIPQWFAKKYVY